MIKVEHLHVRHQSITLFEDLSFALAQKGFVSFCAEQEASSCMAKLLSAQSYPRLGAIWFQDTRLDRKNVMNGTLRASFVQGLFGDFQLLQNKSVFYNVTLDLPYQSLDVETLLKEWGLDRKKYTAIEDLEFEDQAKTIIVRCLLRHTKMIVYDVQSSPFSLKERERLYQLLKKCSKQLLIVVCGDAEANKYADQIIECQNGYLLSDTLYQDHEEHLITLRQFHLPVMKKKAIWKDINQRSLWKFRILFLCLLVSAIAINVVVFNAQLHLVELEESVLSSRGQNAIQIEKQAVGDDGKIYSTYYEPMTLEDGEALEDQIQGNLIYSYEVENPRQEMERIYGTLWNEQDLYNLQVVELKNPDQLGLKTIKGRFPNNYFEVCISSIMARQLLQSGYFEDLNPEHSQVEDVVGETILWFDRYLRITGIVSNDENENLNIQIQQVEENGSKNTSYLYQNNLFVKKGFIQNHDVSKQLTFPNVIKQLTFLGQQTISLDQIRYQEGITSYYDGAYWHDRNSWTSDDILKENEVYLDFYSVYQLIYKTRYWDVVTNDDMTLEEKQNDYYNVAATLVGKTMEVGTYRISGASSNSTFMNQTVVIKGILADGGHIFDKGFDPNAYGGKIIMNKDVLLPYMKENYQVDKLLYQSDDREEMIETLNYLKEHEYYVAFVSNSRMFQAFVVDIKALKNVLLFIGISFLGLYLMGFLYLLDRNRRSNRKEMTIYYLFGETKQRLVLMYLRNASFNLLRYSLFSGIASLIVIYILIYFVYTDFVNIDIPILFYIMIPIVFLFCVWIVFTIIVYGFMKIRNILEDCVNRKKDMVQ